MGARKRVLVAGERKAASECRPRSGIASRRAAERKSTLRGNARQGERSRCCPAILIAKSQAVHAGGELRCGSGLLGTSFVLPGAAAERRFWYSFSMLGC